MMNVTLVVVLELATQKKTKTTSYACHSSLKGCVVEKNHENESSSLSWF
jgi:hypothetical protein